MVLEATMPRLIHMLAHHPDFSAKERTDEDLTNFAAYFAFYCDTVATAESLPVILHFAQRIKQVGDVLASGTEDDNNIYVLSEIAQLVISSKAEHNGWSLLTYPKRLKLPTDCYSALPDSKKASEILNRSFLTPDQTEAVRWAAIKGARPRPTVRVKARDYEASEESMNGADGDDTAHGDGDLRTPSRKRTATNGKSSNRKQKRSKASDDTPPSERRSSARKRGAVKYKEEPESDSEESMQDSAPESDTDE